MVVLGLGANLGNPIETFRKALLLLQTRGVLTNYSISPIYESDPLLPPDAPKSWAKPFLNFAVSGETRLSPEEIIQKLKEIEKDLGRSQQERWAPREIDIDLLVYGEEVIQSETLNVPHADLAERPFAIGPVADLCPIWKFPNGPFAGTSAEEVRGRWTWGDPQNIPCRTKRSIDKFIGPRLIGIINATPDSFSDGGQFNRPEVALERASQLIQGGAEVLDIGAESTRPGGRPVHPDEEWNRLEPVLTAIKERFPVEVSVDTRNAETAKKALSFGVDWINDVSGLDRPEMRTVLKESKCKIVFMHHLTLPVDPKIHIPEHVEPVGEILKWAKGRLHALEAAGFKRERLVFDPGIGFGKTAQQSLEILRNVQRFQSLGVPVLIGHSRKSFFNLLTDQPFASRDLETAILSGFLAHSSVDYLRVHDTHKNRQALRIAAQLNGL